MIWRSCCLIYLQLSWLTGQSPVLPTIVWNPWNPIFSCEDPTIHVQANMNNINFMCPHIDFHYFMPDYREVSFNIYENLYFLDTDEHAYSSCNATGAKLLLRCDQNSYGRVYNMFFRSFAMGGGSLIFSEGKSYYMIGTGFRTMENLDHTVGGSCNTTEKTGQYRLRLKIYVCTQQEITDGQCDICRSSGCFYKSCSYNCSSWVTDVIKKMESGCVSIQNRSCKNDILGESRREYRQIPWSCEESVPEFGVIKNQHKVTDSNTYKYLAVGTSFLFFIIGMLVGVFGHKRMHNKTCAQLYDQRSQKDRGIVNDSYNRSSYYGDSDVNQNAATINSSIHRSSCILENGMKYHC